MGRDILARFYILDMFSNYTIINLSDPRLGEDSESYDGDRMPTTNIIAMAIGLVFIFVLSIAGNAFVFLVFYKRPALINISNRFIVNLTICNMLETVIVMPVVFAALVTQNWYFGKFVCQMTGFLMNAIFAASTLTLVVIAIDRYCAVVTPLHYFMRITPRRSAAMIITVWVLAVCSSLPPLFGWNRYEYQRNKSVCTAVATSRNFNDMSFTVFLVLLCFILPLIVILWAYCVIFKAARNNVEKVRRNSTIPGITDDITQTPLRKGRRGSAAPILVHRLSSTNRSTSLLWRRDEWKAAVTSCMVVFTFILCWLLYFIIIILECLMDNPHRVESGIKTISILLAMSSCAFNPLVYVFRGKIQRSELKTILGIKVKRDNIHMSNGFPPTGSRRPSMSTSLARDSPCISRQGSEESDIIQKLHHVNTATTLTSMVVVEERESSSTRT